MKNPARIDAMGLCTLILSAGIVSACGGGNSSTEAAAVAPAQAVATSPAISDTATTVTMPDAPGNAASSAVAAVSGLQEALDALNDGKALTASLSTIGSLTTDTPATGGATATVDETTPTVVAAVGDTTDASTLALASVLLAATPVKISDEGHSFTTKTASTVRFGDAASNLWVTKTVNGYGECTNAFFGKDPAYGVVKTCQTVASAATALVSKTTWSAPAGQMPQIDLSSLSTPWVGSSILQLMNTTEVAPQVDGGAFRTVCGVARIAFDDPIVFPGQPGKSHLHTFFGNTGVNADSTSESLRTTGQSTCRGGIANRSAYWVPSMIDGRAGKPVLPESNGVYYKSPYLESKNITPVPAGLRMIAGNAAATAAPTGTLSTRFKCIGGPNNENDQYGSGIPNCDVGASVWQEIFFPSCWDGVNMDSPDHKSHMAYPVGGDGGTCPNSHPVLIPQITFNVVYNVTEKDQPLHWRLSSDNYSSSLPGGYSSHGDWFNGWQSDISNSWAKNCLQVTRDCHSHLLGDGRMMY